MVRARLPIDARIGHSARPAARGGLFRLAAVVLLGISAGISGCADPEALADPGSTQPPPAGGGGSTNNGPSASFSTSCTSLGCSVDASASTDSDGTVSEYDWNFGDGATSTGMTADHTYSAAGDFTITLTVTDDDGATSNSSQTVTVTAASGGNNPPTASFVANCTNLVCDFDASTSSDSDGSIAAYDWNFGDGSVAGGVTVSHTFATAGSFTVALAVTDNVNATSTAEQTVSVTSGGGGTLDGAVIYDQKCASCHGADATGGNIARISIVGATFDQIVTAIDTVPNMSSLASMTDAEIKAVADFLGTLVTGTSLSKLGNTLSTLVITDASGKTVTTESNPATGAFLVDGSSLEGGVLVTAYFPIDGSVLYGYSDKTGIINVTPLTSEVVHLATGDGIQSACENPEDCISVVNPASIHVAQTWVANDLAGLFNRYGIDAEDWMNSPFDYQYGDDTGMSALINSLPATSGSD